MTIDVHWTKDAPWRVDTQQVTVTRALCLCGPVFVRTCVCADLGRARTRPHKRTRIGAGCERSDGVGSGGSVPPGRGGHVCGGIRGPHVTAGLRTSRGPARPRCAVRVRYASCVSCPVSRVPFLSPSPPPPIPLRPPCRPTDAALSSSAWLPVHDTWPADCSSLLQLVAAALAQAARARRTHAHIRTDNNGARAVDRAWCFESDLEYGTGFIDFC